MKNRIYCVILILLIYVFAAFAQTGFKSDVSKKGTTAASFLSINQGTRATSIGGAFVGIADDQSAIYWNPAGLAALGSSGVMFDHTQWIADTKYNFFAASMDLGKIGALGLSLTLSDIGEMDVTTIDEPNGTGEKFSSTDLAFSLAYALKLTENFSIGFNPKVIYQKIWKMDATAFAIDIGVLYNTPFKGITLGMAMTNFGSKMQMAGANTIVLYNSEPSNTGINSRIPAELSTDPWSLPLNFKFGLSYRPEISDDHKVIFGIDACHPSDNYESINLGCEYTFNDFISLRAGYKSLFLQDSEESFTLGVGVKQYLTGNVQIKADYAYSDFGDLKSVQRFSISICF
jgi:long-subunit fatty acid transport protein